MALERFNPALSGGRAGLMRFFPMWLRDSELDEKERKQGKDRGLQEADEYLKEHERDGRKVRGEEYGDCNNDFPRQDVAEEPECERERAGKLPDELDYSDEKGDGTSDIEKFLEIPEAADHGDAGEFDNEERDDGEHERDREVSAGSAQ